MPDTRTKCACGEPIPYGGIGRPRKWCGECIRERRKAWRKQEKQAARRRAEQTRLRRTEETVRCRICREGGFVNLTNHLRIRHGVTPATYRKRFPRSPLVSEEKRLVHRELMLDARNLLDPEDGEVYWTRERIIKAIRRWVCVHGYTPIADEWNGGLGVAFDYEPGERPSKNTIVDRFGTWNAAIKAAGYEPRPRSIKRPQPRCKNGHHWTVKNTYHYKNGRRACRACIRDRKRKQRAAARRH